MVDCSGRLELLLLSNSCMKPSSLLLFRYELVPSNSWCGYTLLPFEACLFFTYHWDMPTSASNCCPTADCEYRSNLTCVLCLFYFITIAKLRQTIIRVLRDHNMYSCSTFISLITVFVGNVIQFIPSKIYGQS